MNWIKKRIVKWLLKDLFCAVRNDDIIEVKSGTLYVLGEKKNAFEVEDLAGQAKMMLETDLWDILSHGVKTKAEERMYMKSTTENDLIFGKAMLYNLKVMENILKRLKKM